MSPNPGVSTPLSVAPSHGAFVADGDLLHLEEPRCVVGRLVLPVRAVVSHVALG